MADGLPMTLHFSKQIGKFNSWF